MKFSTITFAIAAPVAVMSAALDNGNGYDGHAIVKRDPFLGIWDEPGATERVANIQAGVIKDPFLGIWDEPGATEKLTSYIDSKLAKRDPFSGIWDEPGATERLKAGINHAIKEAIDSYSP